MMIYIYILFFYFFWTSELLYSTLTCCFFGYTSYNGSQASLTFCVFLWRVNVTLRGHKPWTFAVVFCPWQILFCLWHICVARVRLVFQRVTCSDHWFDSSAALVCLLSSCILKQLTAPPSKLWGKAKTLGLVVFSFYLPFCQPVMPAEERLWAVGCFFIIDSHVGVFYLSLYADA